MFLAVAGALTFTASIASAQDQPAAEGEATEQVQEAAPAEEAPAQLTAEDLLKGTVSKGSSTSPSPRPTPRSSSRKLKMLLLKVVSRRQRKSAATPRAQSPAFSTMVSFTMTKASTWLKRESLLPVVSR